MAETPDRAQVIKALTKPFEPAAIKKHPSTGLSYVEGHTIIRRLNEATANTWNLSILSQDFRPFGKTSKGAERLLITALVELTIPGLGSRQHMGVQVVNAENGGEDMWKGAITDGLKKAATFFGVALDLYGPDWEAGELPDRPLTAPRAAQPRTAPSIPAPVATPPAEPGSRVSRGQLESIDRTAQRGGFTANDLQLMVQAQGVESLDRLTADQATKFIAYLQDEQKANAFLAKLKTGPAQGTLVETSTTSERARR